MPRTILSALPMACAAWAAVAAEMPYFRLPSEAPVAPAAAPMVSVDFSATGELPTMGGNATGGVRASGLPGAVTYAVTAGSLPPGIGLDAATGDFTGSYQGYGRWTVTVQASGSRGAPLARTLTFEVLPPAPVAEVAVQPVALVSGLGFRATLAGTGGAALTGWALQSGPSWLVLEPGTGVLSGIPPAGTTDLVYAAAGVDAYGRPARIAGSYAFAAPRVDLAVPAAVVPGDPVTVRASSNLPSPTYTALQGPVWLRLGQDGVLSGVAPQPASVTTYPFSVGAAQDLAAASRDASLSVAPVVLSVSAPSSPKGGSAYAGSVAASHGTGWSYTLQGAPAWMTVSASGTLSGTVPASGTFANIVAKASRNGVEIASTPFSVTVAPSATGMRLDMPNGYQVEIHGWTSAPANTSYHIYFPGDGTSYAQIVLGNGCDLTLSIPPGSAQINVGSYRGACYASPDAARAAWVGTTALPLPSPVVIKAHGRSAGNGRDVFYTAGQVSWSRF